MGLDPKTKPYKVKIGVEIDGRISAEKTVSFETEEEAIAYALANPGHPKSPNVVEIYQYVGHVKRDGSFYRPPFEG